MATQDETGKVQKTFRITEPGKNGVITSNPASPYSAEAATEIRQYGGHDVVPGGLGLSSREINRNLFRIPGQNYTDLSMIERLGNRVGRTPTDLEYNPDFESGINGAYSYDNDLSSVPQKHDISATEESIPGSRRNALDDQNRVETQYGSGGFGIEISEANSVGETNSLEKLASRYSPQP